MTTANAQAKRTGKRLIADVPHWREVCPEQTHRRGKRFKRVNTTAAEAPISQVKRTERASLARGASFKKPHRAGSVNALGVRRCLTRPCLLHRPRNPPPLC